MAWYQREDYPRIRDMMADAGRLAATYDSWLVSAEQVASEVERSGIAVERVLLRPEEFADWCVARSLTRDGAARSRFANEAAQR